MDLRLLLGGGGFAVLSSTRAAFSANRRLLKLSSKCSSDGLQQTMASVFESPVKLVLNNMVSLEFRKGAIELPACRLSMTLERQLNDVLIFLDSSKRCPYERNQYQSTRQQSVKKL
jgi:hypothetical protein